MASCQPGSSSTYESIAPYRLYLDLSENDKEFTTGLRSAVSLDDQYMQETSLIKTTDEEGLPSTYETIGLTPSITTFKKFIDRFKLSDKLHSAFTLFVPINTNSDILVNFLNRTYAEPLDVLNYHMLDYILTPVELFGRILKLKTKLTGQMIMTKNTNIIISNRDDPLAPTSINQIIQSIETKNGFIYVIQYPLLPYLL